MVKCITESKGIWKPKWKRPCRALSEKYQAPWGLGVGMLSVRFASEDTHSEDARTWSSICAVFHHVAHSILKAQYSRLSRRETKSTSAVRGETQSTMFQLSAPRDMERKHRESWLLQSHTWHIEREGWCWGSEPCSYVGKHSSKKKQYQVCHGF